MRGSIITDSVDETKKIVDKLFNLENVTVFDFKNGFVPKDGKDFDPSNYADIKIILKVGSEANFEFEELVEIQIIQRVNLELKKLDHKL